MAIDANSVNPFQVLAAANRGWYPTKDLEWRLVPGPDGTSTLVVSLYPFFYNSHRMEVRSTLHYVLDVEVLGLESPDRRPVHR